jgi:hypothetical protein
MRFLPLLLIFFVLACSPSAMTEEELQAFVADADHGLRQSVEVNGYQAELTYRPTDLWVKQEIGDKPATAQEVDALRKKYSDYYYFVLSLSRGNKEALHTMEGGMGQYSELVQVMSFRMADYVTMTTSASDTIPVGDSMLNRTYGLSQSTDILFVFNKEKAKNKDWVQFNLNEFGLGLGNQRFRFDRRKLDKAPSIKFNTNNEQPATH